MYKTHVNEIHMNSAEDHLAICFGLNARKPSGVRKITFRTLRQIRVSDFTTDIASLSDLLVDGPVGADYGALLTTSLPWSWKR